MKTLTPHRMLAGATFLALATILSVWIATGTNPAHAQPRIETPRPKTLLDPADTVVLLLDHQAGLFQTVKDVPVAELRTNTTTLAKLAKLMKVPVITTASEPKGPNGPLMPEIHQAAPRRSTSPARARSAPGTTSFSSRPCGRPARRRW